MDRRARNIRKSHTASTRQGTSLRSRRTLNDENQNNGGQPPHSGSAGANSDDQHVNTPKDNHMSLLSQNLDSTTTHSGFLNYQCEADTVQDSSNSKLTVTTVTPTNCRSGQSEPLLWNILTLPDDVLFLIFTYLQPIQLCRLSCVCRRLQQLASKDTVWMHHAKTTAVVKYFSNCRPCSAKELCRVAPNWKHGQFKEGLAVKHKHKLMPWVQKTDDGLWYSMGRSIHCFQPYSCGHVQEDKDRCLHGMEQDATRFVVKKDKVVSGCRDGSVCCWDVSGTPLFYYKQVHRSDTQCVDFTDSVVISGSRDTTCKILPMETSSSCDDLVLQTFDVGERVWSLKISPYESLFAVGLAGCLDDPPVVIWDIESGECLGQLSMNHRRGAGVLDLRFESQHELLTCGYDTFIRMWDLRTQTCIKQWEEPHDSALYCIESDGNNAILVGTARHGMVRLWDKRKTEPLQVYYSKSRNSPVYSLAMDYAHLYLALDVGLNVMDFSSKEMNTVTAGCSTHLQDMSGRQNRRIRHSFKR